MLQITHDNFLLQHTYVTIVLYIFERPSSWSTSRIRPSWPQSRVELRLLLLCLMSILLVCLGLVSPPDFLNSGGNSNHDVGSPFHHSVSFLLSLFTALMREFSWLYDMFLSLQTLTTNGFFLPTFCSPASAATKRRETIIAGTRWGSGM